jgi:hypothetical protein
MMKIPDEKFSDYIIAKEGQKPLIVKPQALKKLAKDRNLLGDDLVFCDLQKVWKKARNVQGLRTLFAKLESNLNNSVSNPEVEEAFDLIGEIERENLSNQPLGSNKTIPNLLVPIESEPELPDNNGLDTQQPTSLQNAIKHLQNKSNEDDQLEEEEASFYSKYCKPKYMAYVGIFVAFYVSGYYIFFSTSYSLPENKEVIHGKVMLDNKPLVSGAVIATVNDKEISGAIGPTGNYSIQNPPKGDINFRIVSFVTPTKGPLKSKNISVIPPVYNKLGRELSLNYNGGIKVFDINLKLPVPPPNK